MNIKGIPLKKIVITIFVIFIGIYVIFDVAQRIIGRFQLQGYEIAVGEMIMHSGTCEPFSLFWQDEDGRRQEVNLINIECLQEVGADEGFDFEGDDGN